MEDKSFNLLLDSIEEMKQNINDKKGEKMSEIRKICDLINFSEDIPLVNALNKDNVETLGKGTECIVCSRGNVMINEGKLRGKIMPRTMFDFEVEGINTDNLLNMLVDEMINKLPYFDEYMEGYEVTKKDIVDELSWKLSDFID